MTKTQGSKGSKLVRGSPTSKNYFGVPHFKPTSQTWEDCFFNPANAAKEAEFFTYSPPRGGGKPKAKAADSVSIFKARLASFEAMVALYKKQKAPTAASAMNRIDSIVANEKNNENAKMAALTELAINLSNVQKNDGASPCSRYLDARALLFNDNNVPILDSRASTTFFKSDDYLPNPKKHKIPIATANVKSSFTKSSGKYKLNTRTPIYLPALSDPYFNQNIISIGQLALKHKILFIETGCYLRDLSTAPAESDIIEVRGPISLYRLKQK